MSIAQRLHLKTYVLIVLMVLFGATGDVLLGKGMRESGGIALKSAGSIVDGLTRGFHNRLVWMGMGSLIVFFLCYLLVLSWADYSFVSPASASSYGIVTLLGWMLLGETVTSVRWLGVVVICVGVLFIGHTPPRTTQELE
ncbi:MAG TPA: EamA family transporter [Candidatus Acidoferrales bacterium]|nr:EamA family transporter [Candidatus Acidoferrales bacterium]